MGISWRLRTARPACRKAPPVEVAEVIARAGDAARQAAVGVHFRRGAAHRPAAGDINADAAYDEAVANYRGQVLTAFREVEDNLSDQRLLAEQSLKLDAAAAAAGRTTALVKKRYDEGDVNYFEVVDAERSSLAAARAAVQARGQRFVTAVALVRALGGGWETGKSGTPDGVPAPAQAQ